MTHSFIFYVQQTIPFVCVIIAYLIGSIPTSYLVGRIFFKTDIRHSGSGNIGATNALRTFGAKAGIIVLIIDVLKGFSAILIARFLLTFAPSSLAFYLFSALLYLAVVVGHVFSVYMKFKGGKGVATAAGVFIGLAPIPLLYCLILFVFVVAVTKYVSLGSALAGLAFMLIEFFSQFLLGFPNVPRLVAVVLIVILILFKHIPNFKRLHNGIENKINFRKKLEE